MWLQNDTDLIVILGACAGLFLIAALAAGLLAVMKNAQVRDFQDKLFKAERKIDQLERRMFNVLNAVPVALVETDTTGKFTFANRAAHVLLGRKESELINMRFHAATWGISYPDGRPVAQDLLPIARSLRGQTVKGFQHLLARPDHSEKILVSVTSMPVMNSVGEVIGTTSAIVEIESESGAGVGDLTGLWRGSWFTASPVPFIGLDQQGLIVDLNQAACDSLHLIREQALGQQFVERFIFDLDQSSAQSYFKDALNNNIQDGVDIALRLKSLDGRETPYLVCAWAVKASEIGDQGLTLMAMPAEQLLPDSKALDDATLLIEEARAFDENRRKIGFGFWYYDPDSDSIIEDDAFKHLIGRKVDGGPTQIAPEDQTRTDEKFAELMSGLIDHFSLEIKTIDAVLGDKALIIVGQVREENGLPIPYGWLAHKDLLLLENAPVNDAVSVDLAPSDDHSTALNEALTALAARDEEAQKLYDEALELKEELAALKESLSDLTLEKQTLSDEVFETKAELLALKEEKTAPVLDAPTLPHPMDAQAQEEIEALKSELKSLHTKMSSETYLWHQGVIDPKLKGAYDQAAEELNQARAAIRKLEIDLYHLKTQPKPEPEKIIETKIERIIEQDPKQADMIIALNNELSFHARALEEAKNEADVLRKQVEEARRDADALRARPLPLPEKIIETVTETLVKPDPDQARRIAELEFELYKFRAAYSDLSTKHQALEHEVKARASLVPEPIPVPIPVHVVEPDTSLIDLRLNMLEQELQTAQGQHEKLQKTVDQLTEALNQAQRFETIGRLTADVAQDFAQMLSVVNHALEVMNHQSDNSDQVRKLSEAALAAGKRGERLTRQLQAFNQNDYW